MSHDWTRQVERGSPVMLRLIRWIAMRLGRMPARLLLYPITVYFLFFAPVARRASYGFLARATGRPVHWWHVAKHIHHFAATILDRVYLLGGRLDELDIRLHGLGFVTDTLQSGSGCILLGSHLGSFEVLRSLALTRRDFPLKVLMHESHNRTITYLLHAINPDIAGTVIPLGNTESLLKAYEYVQQGYFLGILGDRALDSEKSTRCEFLGEAAAFPTGPVLAASILKTPVIMFFGLYDGGRCYNIYFEKLADRIVIDRASRNEDLRRWTQKYADRLAYHACRSPYNWFNFYDFWNSGP